MGLRNQAGRALHREPLPHHHTGVAVVTKQIPVAVVITTATCHGIIDATTSIKIFDENTMMQSWTRSPVRPRVRMRKAIAMMIGLDRKTISITAGVRSKLPSMREDIDHDGDQVVVRDTVEA